MTDDQPIDDRETGPDGSRVRDSEYGAITDMLTPGYSALVGDLTRSLDVAAGSTLVVLAAKRDRLIGDVSGSVDLTGGLAGTRTSLLPDEVVDSPSGRREVNSLRELVAWLGTRSIRDRLDFRTHTAAPRYAPSSCKCLDTRKAIVGLIRLQLQQLESDLAAASGNDGLLITREILDLLDREGSAESSFETQLAELLSLAVTVREILKDPQSSATARHRNEEVMQDLLGLEAVMNDYRNVDFGRVDLTNTRLKGVRWSSGTTWPDDWKARIEADSTDTGHGIFIIRGNDPILRGPGGDDRP